MFAELLLVSTLQQDVELCTEVGQAAHDIAMARDAGMDKRDVVIALSEAGYQVHLFIPAIESIFSSEGVTPREIGDTFFEACINDHVQGTRI